MTNSKIVILILIIALVSILALLFLKINAHPSEINTQPTINAQPPENFTEMKDFIFNASTDFFQAHCAIPLNQSLINIAHIVKTDNSFRIACQNGNLYSQINYKDVNDSPVFLGQIRKCDESAAVLVNQAIRSFNSCFFPINSSIPNGLNDYYVYYLGCDYFPYLSLGLMKHFPDCYKQLNISNYSFYSGAWAVLDWKNSKIYY